MITVETHQDYVSKVTADDKLQKLWQAKIGDTVIARSITMPKVDLWELRSNKGTSLHSLNESDIIFIGPDYKAKYFWVPRMDDLLELILIRGKLAPREVFAAVTDAGADTIEEGLYDILNNFSY
jgi:hypothetical protein